MLLQQSRKKFRFQVTPSDRQLWAIGMVTVQWSLLEGHIKAIAHGLYGDDAAARAEFDQTLVFRQRLRRVRDLIDQQVLDAYRANFIAIIDRIGALALERDRIVHGTWSSDQPPPPQPDEPGPVDESTHVSGTAKPKPAFEWRLTYERMMDTAYKIDGASFEIMNFLTEAMGKPPNFLMSEALQRISRKLGPKS
jgi:hypothetical protein